MILQHGSRGTEVNLFRPKKPSPQPHTQIKNQNESLSFNLFFYLTFTEIVIDVCYMSVLKDRTVYAYKEQNGGRQGKVVINTGVCLSCAKYILAN